MGRLLILTAYLVVLAGNVQALSWSDFDRLVGTWNGTGTEPGNTLAVTHTWEWIYGGKFLRLTTHLVATGEDGSREVRENIGYLSFDIDRLSFVFRQFFSAGYVAAYDVLVKDGGSVIDFGERAAESAGGVRARMLITFTADDSYEQEIELAIPRRDLATRQRLTMWR